MQQFRFLLPVSPLCIRTILGLLLLGFSTSICFATPVFFNELHYDNAGSDSNEGFEVAGPAGQDLGGWTVSFYNGSNGAQYGSSDLSGFIPDEGDGFGALSFAAAGLQNGPDGLALANAAGALVQFISYEGSFLASAGSADGAISEMIGVFEGTGSGSLDSLQLNGSGTTYEDFRWAGPLGQSFGVLNNGQVFTPSVEKVPSPPTLLMLLLGLAGLLLIARTRHCAVPAATT